MRAGRALPPGFLEKLAELQVRLSSKAVLEDRFEEPVELVAGIDVAFRGDRAFGACVLLSYPSLEVLEVSTSEVEVRFPYIPGFLAFREVPAMLKALRGLSQKPDVVLVDAQGIAHPRRCGEATHLGVVARLPTVGVAKKKLCGHYWPEPRRPDTWSLLVEGEELLGFIYLSKKGCRPIVISPGNMVGFWSALNLVRSCLRGHKLPEPTRLAHIWAGRAASSPGA